MMAELELQGVHSWTKSIGFRVAALAVGIRLYWVKCWGGGFELGGRANDS